MENKTFAALSDYNQAIELLLSQSYLLEKALERYNIELSRDRHGNIVFEDLGIDARFLLDILLVLDDPRAFDTQKFEGYPVPIVLEYLTFTHAYYMNKWVHHIDQQIKNLIQIAPEPQAVYWYLVDVMFHNWIKHLKLHIDQEEQTLFPYIRQIIKAREEGNKIQDLYSIQTFEGQHDDEEVEEGLGKIRELIHKHLNGAQQIQQNMLLTQLQLFERDLYVHSLIEDRVLIPKVRKIETSVR